MNGSSMACSEAKGDHRMHAIRNVQAAAVLAFGFLSVVLIGAAALTVVGLAAIAHGTRRLRAA